MTVDHQVEVGAVFCDVLKKQVLNVTMGQLLTTVIDTAAVFDLSVPRFDSGPGAGETWRAPLQAEDRVGFVIDGTPVLLRMTHDASGGD